MFVIGLVVLCVVCFVGIGLDLGIVLLCWCFLVCWWVDYFGCGRYLLFCCLFVVGLLLLLLGLRLLFWI